MIKYSLYKAILEFHDSTKSHVGRWRIKPKYDVTKIDLTDDVKLNIGKRYDYKGIHFSPQRSGDSYFTIIQDPSLDTSGNELYAGMVVYSDSIEDLKDKLSIRIEEYINQRDRGELNESFNLILF